MFEEQQGGPGLHVLLCNGKRHPERQPWAGCAAWQVGRGQDFRHPQPLPGTLVQETTCSVIWLAQRPRSEASVAGSS